MPITHDSFCHEPAGPCYYLTCTCTCHELCPTHGYRQPCYKCRINQDKTGLEAKLWWTTVRPALGQMTTWPRKRI